MSALSRRTLLTLLAAAGSASLVPPAFAQGVSDRRFIFVILRGAMDGLAALIPDDRETEGLRGAILPAESAQLDLGNGFRLHPALTDLHALYGASEAAFVHAVASPYRDRSHFDGQDVLETMGPAGTRDGWLNRALQAGGMDGLAVGYALPLALKGDGRATNWSPPVFDAAPADTLERLADLYAGDPVFAAPLAMARSLPEQGMSANLSRGGPVAQYRQALSAIGELMAPDGAPGVGMVSLDGWDTHANQPGVLQTRLQGLNQGVVALKDALGDRWASTCVVMCSEFGRTAAANGTRGTDHGTGGLAILAGGAVAGGRMHGDWPGLAPGALHEGRDLAPANDLAGLLKGVLRDHLGLDRARLDSLVLPGGARPMDDLII
jgi:uncharacterized protein (DUF1501 family)